MKILVQNYSTKASTEATYLAQSLRMAGVECELWSNPNVSTYDILDRYRPDIFMTHYRFVTEAMVKYISLNGGPELVLNVTGATPEEAQQVEQLTDSGIKIPLIYTNTFDHTEKFSKLKLKGIYPAADIFMQSRPTAPSLPLGVLNDGDAACVAKAVGENDVFHLLAMESGEYCDADVNVGVLHQLYSLYKRFVLTGDIPLITSQIFFDSCLACHKVDILPSEASTDRFNNFLGSVFEEPKEEPENLGEHLKKQILIKHTPFNRAERLMRFLKNDKAVLNLQKLKNQVVKN